MTEPEIRLNHALHRHRRLIPLVTTQARLEEIDAMLHNVWYMVRLCADIAGEPRSERISMDAEAITTAMRFFADELAHARASIRALELALTRRRLTQ